VIGIGAVTFRRAIVAAYSVFLIVAALAPPSTLGGLTSLPDWVAHALAYGVQAGLLFWAMAPTLGRGRALVIGVVGAVGFGVVTEVLQLLQPGRAVELKDLLANTVGAVSVCAAIAIAGCRLQPRDR